MENNNNVENNETKVMDPAEIQKNKVKEITEKLETGIKELFDSEKNNREQRRRKREARREKED